MFNKSTLIIGFPGFQARVCASQTLERLFKPARLVWVSTILTLGISATAIASPPTEFGTCSEKTTAPEAVTAALDKLLISLVDPDNPKSASVGYGAGAVLSVKAPDWQYVKSAGHTLPNGDIPIDCSSPYQVGSSTKMMTTTVILQLQEEKSLSLDDRLSIHLPDAASTIPNGDVITLRQLATHTAGVFSYTDDAPDGTPGIMEGDLTDPKALARGYSPEELVSFAVQNGEPGFPPGKAGAWSYSNTGYVLLGQIIEKITSKPLAKVFEERIFDPLKMSDTFLWNDVPKPEFGLTPAYFGPPFDIETTDWNMSQGWAAGAVISTAADMAKFIAGLLEGRLFNDASTLGVMQETVPTGNGLMPHYGIGLIERQPGLWGHAGQTLGYSSDAAYFPEENISIVVWTPSASSAAGYGSLLVSIALHSTGTIAEKTESQ